MLSFFSAHDLIEITLNLRTPPRNIIVRDYSKFDLASFQFSLASLDWSALDHAVSLDDKVELLTSFLLSTRDRHIPLRLFRAKRPPAPWISHSLRLIMRRKDAARKVYRAHLLPQNRTAFIALRNKVSSQIATARDNLVLQRLNATTTSSRLWSEIRSLLNLDPIAFPISL